MARVPGSLWAYTPWQSEQEASRDPSAREDPWAPSLPGGGGHRSLSLHGGGGGSPVQELPVLASPLVSELLCVHASDAVEVRLVDPEEAKAVHLPVAWGGEGSPSDPRSCKPFLGGHSNVLAVLVRNWEPWMLEEVPRGRACP